MVVKKHENKPEPTVSKKGFFAARQEPEEIEMHPVVDPGLTVAVVPGQGKCSECGQPVAEGQTYVCRKHIRSN